VLEDLKSVTQYAKTIETSNGKIVSAGFCWGGSQSFTLATASKDITAAMVFYGS
jgi:carboxymethylenebutenolidase